MALSVIGKKNEGKRSRKCQYCLTLRRSRGVGGKGLLDSLNINPHMHGFLQKN